ncbi:hypothetical protein MACH15_12400 [Maricaulis maris]|jgi:hypothetical protein|nr:hypothetical protein MACH15_12400 [Maricaulis maris]
MGRMADFSLTGFLKIATSTLFAVTASASVMAQSADPKATEDDMLSAQVIEALILAGADHPIDLEGSDYVGVLEAQGLSPSLPGVLASLFGSLPTASDGAGAPNHAELMDSCESASGECSLSVLYIDMFDGERSESAVILTFTLLDGRLAPGVPVRLDLAG